MDPTDGDGDYSDGSPLSVVCGPAAVFAIPVIEKAYRDAGQVRVCHPGDREGVPGCGAGEVLPSR